MRCKFEAEKNQLLAEIESERSHHQRILKDHNRLQQRYENLQEEVEILQSPTTSPLKNQITSKSTSKALRITVSPCKWNGQPIY